MKIVIAVSALAVLLCSCTWVPLDKAGTSVRVANVREDLSACTFRGDVTTTVTNRVAGIERNSITVADELETLARNEAARLHANTLQAKSEAAGGEQRFAAYDCR